MGEFVAESLVWVRWQRLFWPAQVVSIDQCPEEVADCIKKDPVAIVKFLNEDY